MCLSREKPCIPRKTLPGKGLSQETQMQGKKQVVKQQSDKETQEKERKSRRKTLQNPKKGDQSPVWSPILLRGKSLYG
jgi:hypothetical protein